MTGKHAPPPIDDFHPRNSVPDYVDLMADTAEKSYRIQIWKMGFKLITDGFWEYQNGGDKRQDIYLIKFGSLGLTVGEWYTSGRVTTKTSHRSPYYLMKSQIVVTSMVGGSKSETNVYIETTMAYELFHGV